MNEKEYIVTVSFETKEQANKFKEWMDGHSNNDGIALYIKPYYPVFFVIDWIEVKYLELCNRVNKLIDAIESIFI